MMLFAQEGAAMCRRRSPGRAASRARATIQRSLGMVVLLTAAAAGCSTEQASPPASKTRITACGTAKTAADVPVKVLVANGSISCRRARAVVLAYAEAIRSGRAPGNGGGGPVKIRGWTCQGFTTPVVLKTGKAAKCARHGIQILEILPPPPSPSAS
jgi:hypothetical protein